MNKPKHLVPTAFPSFRTSGTHNSFVNVRAGSRGGAAGSPEDPEAPGEIVRIGRLPALGLDLRLGSDENETDGSGRPLELILQRGPKGMVRFHVPRMPILGRENPYLAKLYRVNGTKPC